MSVALSFKWRSPSEKITPLPIFRLFQFLFNNRFGDWNTSLVNAGAVLVEAAPMKPCFVTALKNPNELLVVIYV